MTRILYVNPLGSDAFDRDMLDVLRGEAAPGTEVAITSLKRGPHHVEYHYYEALVLVDTLHAVKDAEKKGYDGVVLGCFYDLGLQEARELVTRSVVTAPAESSMLLACSYGDKFSIIVGRRKWLPQMNGNVVKYGLKDRLASFKVVDLGVLDFQRNKRETERRLDAAAREAVEKDHAEVVILGCTAEFGFWRTLQQRLGVPVIDPVLAPFKHAEWLVELRQRFGWSHSKIGGYEAPPLAEIRRWDLGAQYATDVWYEIPRIKAR